MAIRRRSNVGEQSIPVKMATRTKASALPASVLSLVGLSLLLLAWSNGLFSASEQMGNGPVLVITTVDSRVPFIPSDPAKKVDFLTMSTIHNHLYAKAHGGRFIYNVLNTTWAGQGNGDPRPLEAGRKQKQAYCKHPEHGWRAATFCKSVVPWHMMTYDEPKIDYLVFIDNDAVFRSPDISVWRHLKLLSNERPFGVLGNAPYDYQPNTGYWFVKRGREVADTVRGLPRSTGADFLLHWWNQDWADVGWGNMEEQATLRRMLGWDMWGADVRDFKDKRPPVSLRDRAITLMGEWQFEEKHEDQMILHQNHFSKDRFGKLASKWKWEISLDDHEALQAVLDDVEIRYVDANEYAEAAARTAEADMLV